VVAHNSQSGACHRRSLPGDTVVFALATGRRLRGVLAVESRDRERYLSAMAGEPAIVVGDRKELTYLLCQGAELEHGLMCQYL
jgi:hypothetical protein